MKKTKIDSDFNYQIEFPFFLSKRKQPWVPMSVQRLLRILLHHGCMLKRLDTKRNQSLLKGQKLLQFKKKRKMNEVGALKYQI